MPPQTNVASFVLRFMQDGTDTDTDAPPASWRGVIKHVQTNEEKHFTSFADAIDFIAGYVNLNAPFDELRTLPFDELRTLPFDELAWTPPLDPAQDEASPDG